MIIRTLNVLGGGDGSADNWLNNKPIDLPLLMVKNHKGEIVRWEDYKDEFGKWYRESDLIQQDVATTPPSTTSSATGDDQRHYLQWRLPWKGDYDYSYDQEDSEDDDKFFP